MPVCLSASILTYLYNNLKYLNFRYSSATSPSSREGFSQQIHQLYDLKYKVLISIQNWANFWVFIIILLLFISPLRNRHLFCLLNRIASQEFNTNINKYDRLRAKLEDERQALCKHAGCKWGLLTWLWTSFSRHLSLLTLSLSLVLGYLIHAMPFSRFTLCIISSCKWTRPPPLHWSWTHQCNLFVCCY